MSGTYQIPTCPSTLMCESCKGFGTLGGSSYVTETCSVCKGTGMIQKEGEHQALEEKRDG